MNHAPTLEYRVQFNQPQTHCYIVECRIPAPNRRGQRISFAAWTPGSYMVRDFAKNVLDLQAIDDDGNRLEAEKEDKQTWRVEAPERGSLTVRYEVYAWELSVRAAHLDATHAYFNGTSLFCRVHDQEKAACVLHINRPEHDGCEDWVVATSMPRAHVDDAGFGRYAAGGYEELVDHPFEISRLDEAAFTVDKVPHRLVVYGRHHADLGRIANDLEKICRVHVGLFGELPVDEQYLFLTTVVGEGYGGLEHRSSCSLLAPRDTLAPPAPGAADSKYREFLALCSHEYFHLWNVKRIRPRAFQDCDLSAEVHTRLLWVFEGITSYYDELALCRAGLSEPADYLDMLAQTITRAMRMGGRLRQSLAESSFDAWTKFYKQDENAPNAIVSYYTKGALVALALDLTLRLQTKVSLDHVMREAWRRFGVEGRGMGELDFEALVNEVSGLDLEPFFERAVRGTEDPDLAPLLDAMGVEWILRPAVSAKDKGGRAGEAVVQAMREMGVRLDPACAGGARIAQVRARSGAEQAGLAPFDEIIAVDGLRVDAGNLETLLQRYKSGASLRVDFFRRDELRSVDLQLGTAPANTCELSLMKDVDEHTAQRREAWLRGVLSI